ncbi:MAG TPA: hypothetical protein DCO83_18400 [Mucilaginibacter sp.]|jgi:hypothetical protein|nr:hypothetical protein [Mucilaginibacter sp.]
MIAEIKDKYKGFHDALILNVNYSTVDVRYKLGTKRNLIAEVHVFNQQTNIWEIIKLIFTDVIKFRFFESKKICSTAIFETYIEQFDDLVVFDFFALQVDGRDQLAEDPNSTFVVHCKEVKYEVMGISMY